MQVLREDRALSHYENHLFKKKKKAVLAKPTVGANPTVIMKDGQPMVKSAVLPKGKKKKGIFKKIVKGVLTGGVANIVQDRKKIAKGITKGAKAVAKVTGKVVKASVLLPLVPLAGPMRASLKKKGLKAPKDLEALVRMFYKVIVKKESAFDRTDHLVPIAALIPPVLAFVKSLIGAKKKGAKLPPEEAVIANEAEKVIDETATAIGAEQIAATEQEAKDEGEVAAGIKNPDGSINFKSPWVIGAAVAIILAVFLIARK